MKYILSSICVFMAFASFAQYQSKVADYKGKPTIMINEKPYIPIIYALTDVPGGRWSFDEMPQHCIKKMGEAGVELFQVDIFLDHMWFEDGTMNYDLPRKQIAGVLQVVPNAKIMFRFHTNPPKWWQKKYPEENVAWEGKEPEEDLDYGLQRILDGDARATKRYSLASKKWKAESSERIVMFCKEFPQYEESKALFAIQLVGGVYGEWHYWGFNNHEPDFSSAMQNHFKEWTRAKYKTNPNLQKAWNDTLITFETVSVPSIEERSKTSGGIFRDPSKEQKVIDYYTCQHNLVADNIIHFNKLVKENWPRPIITGSFYGYFFSVFGRHAAGGHLAVQKVLKSPYVDFLSGPQAYYPSVKDAGEPYRSRSLIHSVKLNGKLWIDEYDQQPVRVFPYKNGTENNKVKFDSVMNNNRAEFVRSLMFALTKGMGLWMYDFGPSTMVGDERSEYSTQAGNNNGWWDHPIYYKALTSIIEISKKAWEKPYKSESDMLVVYDTDVFYHLSSLVKGDPVSMPLLDWTLVGLYKSGVIFDPIHIEDLTKVNLSQYKTVVFMNTFLMHADMRTYIKNYVCKDNRHVIYFYAPGYTDGTKLNVNYVSDLTNMKIKTTQIDVDQAIKPDGLFAKYSTFGPWGQSKPVFYVEDKEAISLGKYVANGLTGFAMKKNKEFTSWYIANPIMNEDLVISIIQKTLSNQFSTNKDVVYGGNGLIMVHSKKGGKKTVNLANGKKIEYELDDKSNTVLIDIETGDLLFK